jgi:hypothetical protein
MTELIAIPFGKEGIFDYKHFFFGQDKIPATEESTFEELRALHKTSFLCHEEDMTGDDVPVGFWLLTKESYTTIEIVADIYSGNERCVAKIVEKAAKKLCEHLAVKTLKDIP